MPVKLLTHFCCRNNYFLWNFTKIFVGLLAVKKGFRHLLLFRFPL